MLLGIGAPWGTRDLRCRFPVALSSPRSLTGTIITVSVSRSPILWRRSYLAFGMLAEIYDPRQRPQIER
jgi:hypothetical protein